MSHNLKISLFSWRTITKKTAVSLPTHSLKIIYCKPTINNKIIFIYCLNTFNMSSCEIMIPSTELSLLNLKSERFNANRKFALINEISGNCGKFNDKRWNTNFLDLLEFICIHGHSNIPSVYKKNTKLGGWVNRLRKNYRLISQGQRPERIVLTEKRIWMLNQINFNWDPKADEFNFYFSKLLRYKKIHGHVHIHTNDLKDAEFQSLSNWVKSMRNAYLSFSKGIPQKYLTHEKVMKLEALNFQWTIADGKTNNMLDCFQLSVNIASPCDGMN